MNIHNYIKPRDMMYLNKLEYINKKIETNVAESTLLGYLKIIKTISHIEYSIGKSIVDFSKNDFIEFYLTMVPKNRSTYSTYQNKLLDYLRYLNQTGSNVSVSEADIPYSEFNNDYILKRYYFKDFMQLFTSMIKMREKMCIKLDAVMSEDVFCTTVCCCCFLFLGIDFEEMTSFQFNEIDSLPIDYVFKEFIIENKIFLNNNNDLILGGNSVVKLRRMITFFEKNNIGEKHFKIGKIKESGQFDRVYKHEQIVGLTKFLDKTKWCKLFDIPEDSKQSVLAKRSLYFEFVNCFYPEYDGKYGKEKERGTKTFAGGTRKVGVE